MGALEPATGEVCTCTTAARRTADFVSFLDGVTAHWPQGPLIVILDARSVHRALDVQLWAFANPRLCCLFQPTDEPWLNRIAPGG